MKSWRNEINGLSREALARKFKGMPVPITEKFLKEWVWWWRELPTLANNGWKKIGLKPSQLHRLAYYEQNSLTWMHALENSGGIEEWLYKQERREFAARVKGGGVPELASITFHGPASARVQAIQEFTLPDMTFTSAESREDVARKVFAELEALGWKGKTHSIYPREPRTTGRKNWREIFSAIEAIDCASLLGEVPTDSQRRTIAARLEKERKNRED